MSLCDIDGNLRGASWGANQTIVFATVTWRVLVKDGRAPRYLASGHIVYAAGGGIRAIPCDLSRLETRGDPVEVQADVVMKESGVGDFHRTLLAG